MKDLIVNGKYPVSLIAFLQNFKAPCGAYSIYESASM